MVKKDMIPKDEKIKIQETVLNDSQPNYGFLHRSEDEKLLEDVKRPYMQKLQLFTKMIRRNKTLNKVIIKQKY